ncbi:hypothetical protein CHS0354_021732 [Potamilus streckersoni]|uniref:C2 domain-containing protein n=1 Tax=Potamilus streckersoni TaxID=2493646 RepID=A0AAE0TLA9_9BIVA|nr:hypothetical protein CHS0354_021732 [Potamilus streckersoni]
MECTLGELVGCGGGKLERPLQGLVGGAGSIIVRAEEVSSSKEIVTLHFRAHNLDKKDFFGKSDPFLVFYRANEDNSFTVVHKTEVIKNTLSPTWAPFTIPVRTLCSGDYNRTIKVECYDWDSDGTHDIIGEFLTNLRDLSKGASGNSFDVINPQKKGKKKGYKNSGECTILSCKIETQPSFLDYIQGGTEINFTVAIDFTASNGDPKLPTSLHYSHPHQLNQYATAIQAIGEIIQDYDSLLIQISGADTVKDVLALQSLLIQISGVDIVKDVLALQSLLIQISGVDTVKDVLALQSLLIQISGADTVKDVLALQSLLIQISGVDIVKDVLALQSLLIQISGVDTVKDVLALQSLLIQISGVDTVKDVLA